MPDASPDPTSDTLPKKRRFRLRYSLRSLLIFMLLFSAALALREGWPRPRWQVEHVLRDHWYSSYSVRSAAFSPDGRRIVTASKDHTARVWDSETGRELHMLKGHKQEVISVAFSPDGRRIVTASYDRTARVWDAETGSKLHVLISYTSLVQSAAFSPDGRRIVTSSQDRTARVWDVKTGAELLVLSGHKYGIKSAAFSPDGRRIVTASDDGSAHLWRRVRPEWWWGVFWLPQFWAAMLLTPAFLWSLWRDYNRLMKAPPAASAA